MAFLGSLGKPFASAEKAIGGAVKAIVGGTLERVASKVEAKFESRAPAESYPRQYRISDESIPAASYYVPSGSYNEPPLYGGQPSWPTDYLTFSLMGPVMTPEAAYLETWDQGY